VERWHSRSKGQKYFVLILYRNPAFGAFDDFSDFVESISCEVSESCQVRGSNPCRGATSSASNSGHGFVDSIGWANLRLYAEPFSPIPFGRKGNQFLAHQAHRAPMGKAVQLSIAQQLAMTSRSAFGSGGLLSTRSTWGGTPLSATIRRPQPVSSTTGVEGDSAFTALATRRPST
jgi:hypothetical protein